MDCTDSSKCILIYGCHIQEEELFYILYRLFDSIYTYKLGISHNFHKGISHKFYEDIINGIFTEDNMYELCRYKTRNSPHEESYFLILNKLEIDIKSISNIKLVIKDPDDSDINRFKSISGLGYNKYIVITN